MSLKPPFTLGYKLQRSSSACNGIFDSSNKYQIWREFIDIFHNKIKVFFDLNILYCSRNIGVTILDFLSFCSVFATKRDAECITIGLFHCVHFLFI